MRDLLTPKQVARAIDVSESSIKRWCDKGVIPTQYTAGGHRRITMADTLEFLRTGKYQLVLRLMRFRARSRSASLRSGSAPRRSIIVSRFSGVSNSQVVGPLRSNA